MASVLEAAGCPFRGRTEKSRVDHLKISKSTLYKLAQEGRIPGQKVGKHWRFRKDAIDRWLERTPDIRSPRRGEEDA